MSRLLCSLLIVISALPGLSAVATAQTLEPGWESRMVEVVVELEPGQNPTQFARYFLSQLYVSEPEYADRINHVYTHTITGFSVYLTPSELAIAERRYSSDPMGIQVLMVAPELSIPDRSWFGLSPAMQGQPLKGSGVIVPTGLERTNTPLPESPDQYASVDVAVIDTGVDKTHPQLNVVGGIDCTARPEDRTSYGYDGYGHGTHVAGIIAASWSANGIVGMAPGANIYDVRVLDNNGGGTLASILCGVDWVVGQGIPIANMSLGGAFPPSECGGDDPLHTAICIGSETTVFVVAAGNSSSDVSSHIPAGYEEVVTVSAFADFDGKPGGAALTPGNPCARGQFDDELASFSNYGPGVDIAAPGSCILSTVPEGGYLHASGTSMAAPHVAGAFARWLSQHPGQHLSVAGAFIEWSCQHGTGRKYEGAHTDQPACLLYVGEMPGEYVAPVATPEPKLSR